MNEAIATIMERLSTLRIWLTNMEQGKEETLSDMLRAAYMVGKADGIKECRQMAEDMDPYPFSRN